MRFGGYILRMNDEIRGIVLVLVSVAAAAVAGWFARTWMWERRLRRRQRFFGLHRNAECLLVVNRKGAGDDWSVARRDVLGLMELAGVVREFGANPRLVAHDAVQQGFGEQTEFCLGSPASNQRMAAHLRTLLPGVRLGAGEGQGAARGDFTVGAKDYVMERGSAEYVLLARLTVGESERPLFLACGQHPVAEQAAARYLTRHHARLARTHGGKFCLLLKVVNSEAYGPDVVELVADVTKDAMRPPAKTASEPAGDAA